MGSAGAAASVAVDTIKVGVLNPLTGTLANLGKDNQDGFSLYLASVNGTMAGRKVEPIFVDTQGQADVGLTKAKQLVESDHVQVLMGVVNTAVCYAVAGYVKDVHVPFMASTACGAQAMTTDPKFASPYVTRFTQLANTQEQPAADWAYKAGYRKAIVITSEYQAGIEYADFFGASFVKRGGAIVQEIHPPLNTADLGPYLATLDSSADLLAVFLPGADGLRFAQQFSTYAGKSKPQILDLVGQLSTGPTLNELKNQAVGFIASQIYTEAYDGAVNKAFIQQFTAKYSGRRVSAEAANGYVGAQVLEAALKTVNGKIEQKQPFLDAVYATNLETAKGPVKLDTHHDIVENDYIFQVVKQGNEVGHKMMQVYPEVSQFWDMPQEQLKNFPYGTLKGKWVGMTKTGLDQILAGGKA